MSNAPAAGARQRLLSIDVLRGLTVAFMILVNNAGDGSASYGQLRHSAWTGCTLTDLVFPMFLFIMGVSMAMSFEARRARGVSRGQIVGQVLRRSAIIFLIGVCLNALPVPHLATLRYFGVMQRIGLCYLFAGLALLYLRPRGVAALTALSLVGYWVLLRFVPVPGFGVPGLNVKMLDPVGNLASYIDRLFIPQGHRYHFSFYDPEGILSTVTATATTCWGILVGIWLTRADISAVRKGAAMACSAAVLVIAGLAWNQTFPLNKRLWTSSYVLFTGGISIGLLALLQWMIDRKRWLGRSVEPFLAFGANALTAYIFSEVVGIALGSIPMAGYGTAQRFTYLLIPNSVGPAALRSLIWSILFVGLCFLPIVWLYRRKIIIKL